MRNWKSTWVAQRSKWGSERHGQRRRHGQDRVLGGDPGQAATGVLADRPGSPGGRHASDDLRVLAPRPRAPRAPSRRSGESEFDSMESLARAVMRSRSTVSRFFSGRQTSLSVALAILGKLKLDFDQVFTPRNVD